MAVVGVLARLGVKGVEIRKPEQLLTVNSLIIPGGESTTMAKLAEYHNLFPALREFVQMGKPVWGTCAGLIFLANKATGQKSGGQELVGGLDCTVHRNFFGSQIQSFEAELSVPELTSKEGGPETFRGVFIRAPAILEVGPEVQVLAAYPVPSNRLSSPDSSIDDKKENAEEESKVIVAVRQGNILATAFHPELTADTRWHSYFLKMANVIGEEASSSLVPVQQLGCDRAKQRKETQSRARRLVVVCAVEELLAGWLFAATVEAMAKQREGSSTAGEEMKTAATAVVRELGDEGYGGSRWR
ncbi:Pyridoxal 5-phosphate synthase subunit PdxT/SNO [Sesbania bispinosa]|nr:Pyridoxal 5-phosphate synthase subunit PdxT/SNO [Sesbania bispinosa]